MKKLFAVLLAVLSLALCAAPVCADSSRLADHEDFYTRYVERLIQYDVTTEADCFDSVISQEDGKTIVTYAPAEGAEVLITYENDAIIQYGARVTADTYAYGNSGQIFIPFIALLDSESKSDKDALAVLQTLLTTMESWQSLPDAAMNKSEVEREALTLRCVATISSAVPSTIAIFAEGFSPN